MSIIASKGGYTVRDYYFESAVIPWCGFVVQNDKTHNYLWKDGSEHLETYFDDKWNQGWFCNSVTAIECINHKLETKMKVSRDINDYQVRKITPTQWYIWRYGDGYLQPSGKITTIYEHLWNTKQEAETFLKEFCMEIEVKVNGTKVTLSAETLAEFKKALTPETAYKVGDILVSDNDKVIIAETIAGRVGLMRLSGGDGNKGYFWNGRLVKVVNSFKITKEELRSISCYNWEKV